jgi:2-oxoglutarate ferredoxin oxidoreductase subunit gamma
MCTLVFSDGDTGSPVVGRPSVAIILNQLSFDKYAAKVKPGGFCIVNSTLVEAPEDSLPGVSLIRIPMNKIANELGDPRMVNMVACGAYIAATDALPLSSLFEALKKTLPKRNHRFIPANIKAIETGAIIAREALPV